MLPRVSVIIPFYNDPYVGQAIASVLAQSYPNIEIIVVDDGSTQHQDVLAPFMSRINYLGKANGGTASALNHGIRNASGKYVAWLSSDDQFEPGKILGQVAYMEERRAQISHTDFNYMDEHGVIYARSVAIKYPTAKAFISAMRSGCPVNGCTVMMTKHLVEALGYFNEALTYTHDYEMWIRVLLNRVDFYYLNEPLTIYRRHSQMGTVRHFDTIMREAGSVSDHYAHQLNALLAQLPG
ncbi:glycosyltransferase involved in cell wall biosynthesis [Paenibacillus phyllosphaerae]|uniref:Glycosyltransferase involved in cell wall biosynthesis n=1 Tax=Paenibacillus phyllosphaerae TaxID=274593 RepID=A0A7W5FQM5_9BACL|nr:glycosyltransferase [Paenibacillus phyllosphaerae]MBB3113620.1 glycosyltransferase involved in cell wall biosynthesis [Paenibacillus phyllosphaerae]